MEKPKGFPENLILIGMFGSGKSTLGRLLAAKLRYHFVDVDHLIESRFHKPLQKVLDQLGMQGFMKMEEETLMTLQPRHCIVATGGSAVYYPKAMAYLEALGPRVFLRVPLVELKKRLPEWNSRGVVCRGGDTLEALFEERAPLLKKYSDFTIRAYGRSWEKQSEEILEHYGIKPLRPPSLAGKSPDAKEGKP